MRTDREALIAGIAADPFYDLRKLVFADWLEEHGEPERAEYIRFAIETRDERDEAVRKANGDYLREMSARHWQQWFGPFFEALDPVVGVAGFEPRDELPDSFHGIAGGCCEGIAASCYGATRDGFLHGIHRLQPARLQSTSSLEQALRREPIHTLSVWLTEGERRWTQLTGSSLEQISRLRIGTPEGQADRVLAEFGGITNDPNLSGVTHFGFATSCREEPVLASYLSVFAPSRLAGVVRELDRMNVTVEGLRYLTRSKRLNLTLQRGLADDR